MKKNRLFFLAVLPIWLIGCSGAKDPTKPVTPSGEPTPSVEPTPSKEVTPSVEPTPSSVDPSWEDDDKDYPLSHDTNEDYVIDNTVSNEKGSMSYEIFVRSFYDSDNDQIGDLGGVKAKIPYLADLGIKTIWLMPIHQSSSYHGYDVLDFYSVHSDFGSINDFDALVNEANRYNIDIMIDMVFNHTSRACSWFNQSYIDYKNNNTSSNSKADWYMWSDSKLPGKYYLYNDLYYLGVFDSWMPDLNLDSESLRNEIDNICKFWIEDHGVKGFRLDAAMHYYAENVNKNNEFLGWLEDTTHKYDPNFYMVAEVWTNDVTVNNYYKSGLDSCFRFDNSVTGDYNLVNLTRGFGNPNIIAKNIQKNEEDLRKNNPNGYSSYFVSNHDQDRPDYTKEDYPGLGLKQNKMLASLYGLLPGTPFMYYGEEIQLKGKRNTNPDDRSDAKRRLPMIWSETNKTGECKFPEAGRSDLDDTEQVKKGVDDVLQENYSLVKHYRKVINIRNKYGDIFKRGLFKSLVKDLVYTEDYMEGRMFAYSMTYNDETIYVVHNFSIYNAEIETIGNSIVDSINTTQKIPTLKDGLLRIGALSTVILK